MGRDESNYPLGRDFHYNGIHYYEVSLYLESGGEFTGIKLHYLHPEFVSAEVVLAITFLLQKNVIIRKVSMLKRYFHGFMRDFVVPYESSMTFQEFLTVIVPLLINIGLAVIFKSS